MTARRSLFGMIAPALARPRLLIALARMAWRFRARGWWRRPPFLPLPPGEYLEWRMHTAYGDGDRSATAAELERYARWANRMYRTRRQGTRTS